MLDFNKIQNKIKNKANEVQQLHLSNNVGYVIKNNNCIANEYVIVSSNDTILKKGSRIHF